MTSNLWIPCYNEGTSDISYCPMNRWPTWEKRHVIYQTLCLLKEQILSGTFQKIIISNDGSDDDTLEGIKRFKREHNLRESVFQIIDGKTNEGKMMVNILS